MLFGIFMNEYRRYFKQHNTGWYVGANVGMMAFKMSKPTFAGGKLGLQDRYSKGYGLMFGVCGGYEYRFADPVAAGRLFRVGLHGKLVQRIQSGRHRSSGIRIAGTSPSIPTRSTARANGCPIRSAYRSV